MIYTHKLICLYIYAYIQLLYNEIAKLTKKNSNNKKKEIQQKNV